MATFLWSYFVDEVPRSGLAEYRGEKCWFEHTSKRQMTEDEIEKLKSDESSEDELDVDQIMTLMDDDEDDDSLYRVSDNDFEQLTKPVDHREERIDKNSLRNLLMSVNNSNKNKNQIKEINIYTFYKLKESDVALLEEENERYKTEIGCHREHDPAKYKRIDNGTEMMKIFTFTLNPSSMKGEVLCVLSENEIKQFNIPTIIN